MLQPSPDMGDTLLVEWASGSRGTYHTGYDFELVHLETSLTSGVPVVGKYWTSAKTHNPGELLWGGKELERPKELVVPMNLSGLPVERGTHWTYSEAEPGVGAIKGAGTVRQKGPHNPDGKQLAVTCSGVCRSSSIHHTDSDDTKFCLRVPGAHTLLCCRMIRVQAWNRSAPEHACQAVPHPVRLPKPDDA